jgi:hypothetical protein
MHSALFAAGQSTNRGSDWPTFVAETDRNPTIAGNAERLADGVWLVNFRQSPAALSYLVCAAEARTISYKILPLADEPQWLPAADQNHNKSP